MAAGVGAVGRFDLKGDRRILRQDTLQVAVPNPGRPLAIAPDGDQAAVDDLHGFVGAPDLLTHFGQFGLGLLDFGDRLFFENVGEVGSRCFVMLHDGYGLPDGPCPANLVEGLNEARTA